MRACPSCGKPYGPDVRFCPDDGTPLTDTAISAAAATPTVKQIPAVPLPSLVGGRYRVFELRGGGGMAQVFRAIDTTLEREVAVKLINPELRADPEFDARFQREARIASQLADPHIVVVHDFGIDSAHGPFLVMEYLQGQSLRERLKQHGRLEYAAALQLGAQLLLALSHAHEKGVVHRDIKPDNVFLLNQSGVRLLVRILDFGIARIYRRDTAEESATLTLPGAVIGTPRYMAPEQLAGESADARTDLYSAAIVLFEAMTGQVPYVGGKPLCELCPEADPNLQALLEQCLRPRRDDRPATAAEVYLQIHELGKASGALTVSPETLRDLSSRFQRATFSSPTITYVPKRLQKLSRRGLLIAGGVTMACCVALGLKFGRGYSVPDVESVAGIKIDEDRDDLIARFGKPAHPDLQAGAVRLTALGPLQNELSAQHREHGELLTWNDHHLVACCRKGRVCSVIAISPQAAESGRGVRIGDTERRLKQRYEEPTDIEIIHAAAGPGSKKRETWGMIYRYSKLGLSFVVRDERVIAMALYAPQPATAP